MRLNDKLYSHKNYFCWKDFDRKYNGVLRKQKIDLKVFFFRHFISEI